MPPLRLIGIWVNASPHLLSQCVLELHTLVGAVGGKAICFLEGAKMDFLAGLAFSIETNGLDLDDIVCLLLQVPENTCAAGGVDFTNESLHVSVLPLSIGRGAEHKRKDWFIEEIKNNQYGWRGDQGDHTLMFPYGRRCLLFFFFFLKSFAVRYCITHQHHKIRKIQNNHVTVYGAWRREVEVTNQKIFIVLESDMLSTLLY